MAAVPDREPLVRFLRAQSLTDAEIRRIMTDASKQASAIVAGMGDGVGSNVRRAQLKVSEVMREHWQHVGDAAFVGIGDGADAAGESLAYLNSLMFDSMGLSPSYWRESMLATARSGIDSLRSRKVNGITLSQRVWRDSVADGARIDRLINASLANGLGPREIAKQVQEYVSPTTPGGSSYAAMRLGRSEVNNAFHTTSIRTYAEQPWINGVQWSLSSSHPEGDECDVYAGDVHFKGGEPGVFKPMEVPSKPHPQCFCYISPVTLDDDEFIKRFQQGRFDSYMDGVGCSRV